MVADSNFLSGGADGGTRRINAGSTNVIRRLLVKILMVGSKRGPRPYLYEKKM